jgi:Tol biopolymer transport system component
MSPEQASGSPADYRSDQFSLGAILYEMLTGRRAFQKTTSVETLTAILREDPPPIAPADVPAPLRWIVERCLSKSADERYDSTRDLARDLQRVRDSLSDATLTSGAAPIVRPAKRRPWLFAAAAIAILALLAAAAWLGAKRLGKADTPKFHRLTFRRGFISSARFAPDGQTVVYGAGWEGNPVSIFTAREENSESLALPLPPADVLALTRDGKMAVSLGRHHTEWFVSNGKLAETPLSGGGAPRELMDDVQDADFFPDGATLAVTRNGNAQTILEFPAGTRRYASSGWISHVRVSPDGQRVAFIDHPVRGDDRGTVFVMDRSGKREALSPEYASLQGLAWRPDGHEIWFTGAQIGFLCALHAVTLDKNVRTIYTAPSRLVLQDISPGGRALIVSEDIQVGTSVSVNGIPERDVSWLDCSFVCDISPDGRQVLLDEQGEGAHAVSAVYVRGTDGSPAVRLTEGFGTAFSPDGKSVIVSTYTEPSHLVVTPLGAGATRDLGTTTGQFLWPSWFPDGKRVAYGLAEPGKQPRIYARSIDGGPATPIAPEGVGGGLTPKVISPDGAWMAASGADGKLALWPTSGSGNARPIPNAAGGENALRWSSDGKSLFTYVPGEKPVRLYRVDIATGARTVEREMHPADEAGVLSMLPTVATADGRGYGYTYLRTTGALYVVDGLK